MELIIIDFFNFKELTLMMDNDVKSIFLLDEPGDCLNYWTGCLLPVSCHFVILLSN